MSDTGSLKLNLADASDDELDQKLNETMQGLVDGEIEAAAAARTIDALIVNDCQKGYAARCESIRTKGDAPGDDEETERIGTPSGWVPYLWRTVGQVAIAVPPHHAGQDRLVRFIEELLRLPSHTVSSITLYGDTIEHTFWEDSKNDERFCQEMRLLDTVANSGNIPAFVNHSAFLARVFAAGVMDTTRFCALTTNEFLGLHWPYNKQADKSEPYILTGAQWMMHAGAAMWEMCDKKAYAAKGFNTKWWARWKARFEHVNTSDSGFSQQAREAAAEALKRMEMAEAGHSAGISVVASFGLMVKDWEDSE